MQPPPLPNLLQHTGGSPITTADQWAEPRRPELLALFEDNIYGKTLLGRPPNLTFEVRDTKPDARDGRATRLRIGILFEGTATGRQMELLLYLPNHAIGPVPIFLGLNFDGNFAITAETDLPVPTHFVNGLFYDLPDHRPAAAQRGSNRAMWPIDEILDRGYGLATAAYGEIEPDTPGQWHHGPRGLAPEPGPADWGSIGAWAWALSRAMDYLATNPRVDFGKVALFGFSRLGKTALWAAAQDERFAAVISQNSGKGGISLSGRPVGEPVAHLVQELGHWFAPAYARYANHESALPVDGHALAALVTPRPLLVLSAAEDTWSDPEGEFLAALHATPVYNLLGAEGLNARQWPAPPVFINSRVGYSIRPGGHDVTAEDWQCTLAWADTCLRGG